jgi:cell division protein FtsN
MTKTAKKNIPAWLILLTGLLGGLLIALLLYMKQNDISIRQSIKSQPTPEHSKKNAPPVQFTFWNTLKKSPDNIPDEPRSPVKQAKISPLTTPFTSPQENHRKTLKKDISIYMLQLGSFRKSQDADGFRAKLALLGVESSIQKSRIQNTPVYRVRTGPYRGKKAIQKAKVRLDKTLHLKTLAIKVR